MWKIERFLNKFRTWIYQKQGKYTISSIAKMEKDLRKLVNLAGVMHYGLEKTIEQEKWQMARETLDQIKRMEL